MPSATAKELFKKILLILIVFCSYFLAIVMHIHSLSLFLSSKGPAALPEMMVIVAAAVLLFSVVSTMLSYRYSVTRLFEFLLMIFGALFAGLFFFKMQPGVQVMFYFVVTNIFFAMLDVAVIKFVVSFITPLQGKTLLPMINGFNSIGIMIGAFFAAKFQTFHEQVGIGSLPTIGIIFIFCLVLLMHAFFRKQFQGPVSEPVKTGLLKDLQESFRYTFLRSPIFKTMVLAVFLLVGIQLLTEFKFKTVLGQNLTPEALTTTFSLVYMAESAVLALMNVFFVKRLLFRFGIGNMLIFYPVMMMAVLATAMLFNLQYHFIIAFYLSFTIPFFSYVVVGITQIFSIAPSKINEAIYFLIKGLMGAVFMLFFAVVLLIYSLDIGYERTLNTGMLLVMLALLIVVCWRMRKLYFQELKENLFKGDPIAQARAIDLLAEKSQKDRGEIYLRQILHFQNTPEENKHKTIYSLGLIGNCETLIDLIEIIRKAPPKSKFMAIQAVNMILKNKRTFKKYPVAKHQLIHCYRDLLISDVEQYIKLEIIASLKNFDLEDIMEFLEKNLQSDDVEIRRNVIQTIASFKERAIIEYLQPLLNDGHIRIVCAAIIGLWKFKEMRLTLIAKLATLLSVNTDEAVENLLDVSETIGAAWEEKYVSDQLQHPNAHIRHHALIALITLGDKNKIDEFIAMMNQCAKEDNQSELEFILSKYRHFESKMRTSIIHKIQQMDAENVQHILQAFKNSKYLFYAEISQLSAD